MLGNNGLHKTKANHMALASSLDNGIITGCGGGTLRRRRRSRERRRRVTTVVLSSNEQTSVITVI